MKFQPQNNASRNVLGHHYFVDLQDASREVIVTYDKREGRSDSVITGATWSFAGLSLAEHDDVFLPISDADRISKYLARCEQARLEE